MLLTNWLRSIASEFRSARFRRRRNKKHGRSQFLKRYHSSEQHRLNAAETLEDRTMLTSVFSIDNVSLLEGDSGTNSAVFTVTRTGTNAGDLDSAVTIDFTTQDSTATVADSDYNALSGILSFSADATAISQTETIIVMVNGDKSLEPNETFQVLISNNTGDTTIENSLGTATIEFDDYRIAPIHVNPLTVFDFFPYESRENLLLRLERNQFTNDSLTLDYTTTDQTAIQGEDYEASLGTLEFSPGEISKVFAIPLVNSDLVERDETFLINFTNFQTGTYFDDLYLDEQRIVTILDDDQAQLSISDTSVDEDAGFVAVTVSLDNPVDTILNVDYSTAESPTAIDSENFEATTGTLIFNPGETTQTIYVNIVDNNVFDFDRVFYIDLHNLQASGLDVEISDSRAIVIIEDDDREYLDQDFEFEFKSKMNAEGTVHQGDRYGFSIATDGDTMITTAPYWDDLYVNQGAAFVYVRNDHGTPQDRTDDTWEYQATLTAPDAQQGDGFGWSVDISGDTAVIGAINGEDLVDYSGSAYVFTRSGTTWSLEQEITASNTSSGDKFGAEVAIDGDTIVVGATGYFHSNGTAYVFNRVNGIWSQTANLHNTSSSSAYQEQYGFSIDIEDSTIVIGAPYDRDIASYSGAVFIYNLENDRWRLSELLRPTIPLSSGAFGYSVSLEKDELLIGSPGGGENYTGFVSLYRFNSETAHWEPSNEIDISRWDLEPNSEFGSAVLLQDGMMFIATDPSVNTSPDRVFQYYGSKYETGTYFFPYKELSAPDVSPTDAFGRDIALADGSVLVGSPFDDDLGTGTGTVYHFSETPPAITVSDAMITEGDNGSQFLTFEVSRQLGFFTNASLPATVDFTTVDGTATAASGDYRAISGTINFSGLSDVYFIQPQTETVSIEIFGDTLVEPEEFFSISLSNATGYGRIEDDTAEITIIENDQAKFSIEDITVHEEIGTATLTVTLDQITSTNVSVDYATTWTNTRTHDANWLDYQATSGTLNFAPGEQSKTISVTIIDSPRVEFDETFLVNLTNIQSDGADVIFADDQALVTITDNDQAKISISDTSRIEGYSDSSGTVKIYSVGVKVSLDHPVDSIVTVNYTTADQTAIGSSVMFPDDDDYYLRNTTADYFIRSGTLTFQPGETERTIGVPLIDNEWVEIDETFLVNLTNIQSGDMIVTFEDDQAEVTIHDNDQAVLEFTDYSVQRSVSEEAGTASLYLTLDYRVDTTFTVDYTITSQTATPTDDYLDNSGTLTFSPGFRSRTITIPIVDSSLVEGDETFLVTLSNIQANGRDVVLGDLHQAEVTIVDDEQATIDINDVSVNEIDGTATLTVSLNQPVVTEVSVDYSTINNSARATTDYISSSGTVTFNPGDLTQTIIISIVDSPLIEVDERFLINLTNIQANTANVIFTDSQAIVTITDDDRASISIDDISVDESTGTADLTVSLDHPVDTSVSVEFATADQSAIQSQDYQNRTGTLNFSAGEQTKTFSISLVDSGLLEVDRTFLVNLFNIQSNGRNVVFTDDQAEVTIVDDDQSKVSITDTSVDEAAGTVTLTVTLDTPVESSISVDYMTVSQNADPADDYLHKSGTLTFGPEELTKEITISIVDSDLVEGDETFLVNLSNIQAAQYDVVFSDDQAEITITEDDPATISIDDVIVNEGAGTAELTVSLDQVVETVVKVDFATIAQTATSTDDYLSTSDTLIFNPGDLTQTITIPIIDSSLVEIDEKFLVNLSNIQANNANITFVDDQAEVTITDDDQAKISINDLTVDESSATAIVTVALDHPVDTGVTVHLATADQSAVQAEDYLNTSTTVSFSPEEQTKMITIPLVDSDLVELDKTFLINLTNIQASGRNVIFADDQAEVTITDDDQSKISINDMTVGENEETVVLTVSLDHPVDTTVSIDFASVSNSLADTTDYLSVSGTLIFNANEQTKTITIPIVDSDLVEFDETFLVNLTNIQASGRNVIFADDQAEVTITDDDQSKISINDMTVGENEETVVLTVSLDHPVDTTVSIDFASVSNSLADTTDYLSVSGTLIFSANEQTKTITIPIVDSDLVEFDETFLVNLTNIQASGRNVIFADDQAEVTITDDDQSKISINDMTVGENEETVVLTVSLDHPVDTTVSIDFASVSNSLADTTDYLSVSGTLIFNANEQTKTITIPIVDSDLVEFDETFLVNLTNIQASGRNVIFADDQAEVTITDDDQAKITIHDTTVDESAGTVTMIVTLDQTVDTSITVDFETTNQSATNPEDYQSHAGTLTFNTGEQSKTITVLIYNSLIVEGEETFLVNLSNIQSDGRDVVFADDQASVTIVDETPTISIDDVSVNENESTVTLTVSLDQSINTTVTVDYATTNNSAVHAADYQATSGTLSFNPNEVSKTFTVSIVDSDLVELDETFLVNLTNIQASGIDIIFADDEAEVTIIDDDLGSLSIDDVTVNEDAGVVELTVSVDKPQDTLFTVDFLTSNGEAHSSTDYQHSTGTLIFNPNDLSQIITIPIIDSDLLELDETFLVNLFNVQSESIAPIITDSQAEVTITDDDQATISIDDLTVNENAGIAVLTVTLDQAAEANVNIDFTTREAEAKSDTDFLAAAGTVSFSPGELTKTIFIYLVNSDVVELTETFLVDLSYQQSGNPNLLIADNQAKVTILDHDQSRISIDDVSVDEDAGTATLTVSLDQAVDNQVRVDYQTVDQSALNSQDYVNKSGSFMINPGQLSYTITFDLIDDDLAESAEVFEVELTSFESYGRDVAIADSRGNVEILDYDHELRDPELTSKLFPPLTIHNDRGFGMHSVTDGETLAIVSRFDDSNTPGSGAVFVYTRNNQGTPSNFSDDTWEFEAKITPPDFVPYDTFSSAIAISGDTLVVGDARDSSKATLNGAAYVFERIHHGTWTIRQKLIPSDYSDYAYFGGAVAIEDDTIVVGASLADKLNNAGDVEVGSSGAVYVFSRNDGLNSTWSQKKKLVPSDPEVNKQFGHEIALDGDTVIVGAWQDGVSTDGIRDDNGAVYVFNNRGNHDWRQTQKIQAVGGNSGERFGGSFALEGDTLVIGATAHITNVPGSQTEHFIGGAYVFNRNNAGTWSQSQILLPTEIAETYFGNGLELKNGNLIIRSDNAPPHPDRNSTLHHFVLQGDTWILRQKVTGSNLEQSDHFGDSFALTEDALMVGTSGDDEVEYQAGAVHIYSLFALPEFSIGDVTVTEGDSGSQLVTVPVIRTGRHKGNLGSLAEINFSTIGGTAEHAEESGTITFQGDLEAFSQTEMITIKLYGDTRIEDKETVNIEISYGSGKYYIHKSTGTITVIDNDRASLSIDDVTIDESSQSAVLTVTLNKPLPAPLNVNYHAENLTATNATDFQSTYGTLTFSTNNLTQTITIPIIDSDLVELNETFLVNLFNIQSEYVDSTISDLQAEVTIIDDDQAAVSIDDVSVDEETGIATLTVSLDHPVDGTVTLDYTTADQTALAGDDYQATSGTLTFDPSELSQTITVDLINSDLLEIDKTFLVNLSDLQSNGLDVILPDTQAEVTIVDSDQPTLSINNVTVNENAGTATVTVTLDQTLATAVTVEFSTADDTAVNSEDYQSHSGTLTFAPGESSQTITVSLIDSDVTELDETFLINLTNPQSSEYQITLTDSQSVVTIQDDDQSTISINDITVDESVGTATLTVSLDHAVETPISIDYTTVDGSATSSSDYQSSSDTLTFASGETSKTLTISILDSDLVEIDETLFVNLLNLQANGANVIPPDTQGAITINDDDQASISVNDLSVDEGTGTTTLTVSLDHPVGTTVSVDFETLNGTALNDSDYASTSGTLTFNPGETTQTINLTILEDDLNELPESFFVQLSNLQQNGFNVDLANDQAEVTILSNDYATLSISDVEVNENAGEAILTVSLDQPLDTNISVDYSTANLTAFSTYHYVDSSGTINFNPGEQSQTISIPIIDSDWVELDGRFFFVNLANIQADGYNVIFADDQAQVTIREDDQAAITVDDVVVDEDAGFARMTISVSNPVRSAMLINFTTVDQTAVNTQDYEDRSGVLLIVSGKQTQSINVPIIDSDLVENDETFLFNLTGINAYGRDVVFADNQAQITILDDDQATLSVNDVTVNEAAGTAILTVSLDQPVDATVTVDFSTIDQSATASDDYLNQTDTLTFNPGTLYQTIEIDVVDSDPVELVETFEVQLSNLQSGGFNVTLVDDRGTVTIKDDDLGDLEWKSKLHAAGTLNLNDNFGFDIAVDGDTLISSALFWNEAYTNQGGAFIYVRNDQGTPEYSGDDTWEYQATLLAPDADSTPDHFGWSVAISGDTAIVGTRFGDETTDNMGAVYVYTRSNGIWSFQQELTVTDTTNNGYFGEIVAIEGDTIVASSYTIDNSSGAAFVFKRVNGVWSETAKLTSDTPEERALFGSSIDIENSTIVIGSRRETETVSQSGAVYVFTETEGSWTQSQKLKDPAPSVLGSFGMSVSLEGNLLLIGAPSSATQPESSGKAVLYTLDLDTNLWTPLQTLTASDAALNSFFGFDVEIQDHQIFINSTADPTGVTNNGAVYLFRQENQSWVEQQKISSPDAEVGDFFARKIAITDNTIFISANRDNEGLDNVGSVYVYGLPQNPAISIDNVSIAEEDDGSRFVTATVTRTATKPGDLIYTATVDFQTLDGSATVADNDYQGTSGTLTFDSDPTASSQTQTISIRIYGDMTLEADETFSIELLNVTGHGQITNSHSTVTIQDTDQAAISIDDVTVDENAATATLTVSLNHPIDTTVSIDYSTADQTAVSLNDYSDYSSTNGTLTFNPGDQSQTIVIPINDSDQVESTESFLVNLSGIQAGGRDVIFNDAQAQVTIHDDDQSAVSIDDVTVDEDAGTATLTVFLDLPVDTTVSIDYSTADQTAASPTDFTSTSGTLTFNPHVQSQTIVIPINDSGQVELDETFLVNLTNIQANGAQVTFDDDQAQVTIQDDDQSAVSIDDVTVDEDAGTATLTVSLDLPVDTTVSIDYATANQTAASPTDFTSTSGTLTFDPHVQSQTIVIPIHDSDQVELDEMFLVNLTNIQANGAHVTFGDDQAEVTILDDDRASISINDITVDENAGSVTLTVSLDRPVDSAVSVNFATADQTATDPEDYLAASGTLTFDAGEQSKTITISIVDSDAVELDEMFLVNLSGIQAGGRDVIFGDDQAEVTILDDDQASISINDLIIDESVGTATLTVSLDQPVETTVTVDFATANQTAVHSDDYLAISDTLTFSAGEQSKTITISIVNSDLVEADEAFLVNLSNLQTNGANVILLDSQAEVTINDDDQAQVSINDITVEENAGSVTLTVSLDRPVDTTVSIDYATVNQTAASPTDFTSTSGTLTFNPHVQSQTIVIPINDSDQVELDETFLVNLTNLQANGAHVTFGDDQAQVTIQDDDQSAVSIDDVTVDEDAGTATLTVFLDLPVDTTVSIDYATANQTAASPTDFTSTSGTLTFNPHVQSQTIVIPINDSDQVESSESFLVNLTNIQANGAHVTFGDDQAEVTILDDDQASISINDLIIDESVGTATLTVSLDQPVETTVTVDFATANQTAVHSDDYLAISDTLTFSAGEQLKTITISIVNSDLVEADETFLVNLSNLQTNGANVILLDNQAEVTINDDDQAQISIDDVTVNENVGTVTLTVSLDLPLDTTVSIDYSTADQTAASPADFTSTSGTLTFDPNVQSQTIVIPINDSDQLELDETFLVNLSEIQAGGRDVTFTDDQAQVTIRDDDQATISINDVIVDEDSGLATLTISLDKIVHTDIFFNYSMSDQTAVNIQDYENSSGILAIAAGQLAQIFNIPIIDSDLVEHDETFLVNLSEIEANGHDVIFADDQAEVTIIDDDQAQISINDITVDENAGSVTLTVSLDRPVDSAVSVDFATANQTATDPEDYLAASGTLTFDSGEQSKTITISIVDSDFVELDEAFLVNLTNIQANGQNIIFADDQAEVTIIDDEVATAEVNLRAVNTPTNTDPEGVVAALPDNQDGIDEWSTYWVEIWVNANSPANQGIFSAQLDLNYNTEYTSATEIEFGAGFTQNQAGIIDDTLGKIEGLYAETTLTNLGAENHLLFARVKFESLAEDQIKLDLSGKSIGPHDLGFQVNLPQVKLVNAIPITTHSGQFNGVSMWANPYDLNDNDVIDFDDLTLFVSTYNSIPSESDSNYAWFADLNKNDKVDFDDLVLFVVNYSKSKLDQTSVIYPKQFPEAWSNLLTVNAQTEPQPKAEPITQSTAETVLEDVVEQVSPDLTAGEVKTLENTEIQVVDLQDDLLGRAVPGTIYIDVNAAGYGWFVDSTPGEHSEFEHESQLSLIALPDSEAAGKVDLWTVIMHEVGHILGHEHEDEGIMEETLAPGVRKLPGDAENTDQFFSSLQDETELILF